MRDLATKIISHMQYQFLINENAADYHSHTPTKNGADFL